jgi:uncharacterized protein YjiS (DUF1127 family)
MFSSKSILESLREIALTCTGSPHSRTRQLAALRKLDAHLLADIGLTQEEASRGFALRNAATEERGMAVRLEIRRPYLNR